MDDPFKIEQKLLFSGLTQKIIKHEVIIPRNADHFANKVSLK